MSGRIALVTGATGLVGSHVVERLLRDGWTVRALVRDSGRAGWLASRGVELLNGDVLNAPSFARAARRCTAVFHNAALITPKGGWEVFQRTNIDGTRNAIAAAQQAGARLVHLSSVAVYGASTRYEDPRGVADEASALAALPDGAWYARSKRESEALVLEAHAMGRVWSTALRPDVIYGPRDRQFVPRVARLLQTGIIPLVDEGRTTLAIVHAANVADGVVRAATCDAAGGKAYNLANDYDVTVAEFFRLAGQGLGIKVRILPLPRFLARGALSLFRGVDTALLGGRYRVAAAASYDFITRGNPFSSALAKRELGWTPVMTHTEGVPQAFRWWRETR